MKDKFVDVKTSDGVMECFVSHPEENGPYPAIILYMDMLGMRGELYDIARRMASVGYYCIVPDFYYRIGKIRELGFRNEKNQIISNSHLEEAQRREVAGPFRTLSDAMVMQDTGSLLKFFGEGEPVSPGGVGSFGYCMGGRHVLGAMELYPDRMIAGASLHGTTLISDREDSPHLSVEKLRGEVYCGWAEHDRNTAVAGPLAELLEPCEVKYSSALHLGSEHRYPFPEGDVYQKQGAERDWELMYAMFHRQIPPSPCAMAGSKVTA